MNPLLSVWKAALGPAGRISHSGLSYFGLHAHSKIHRDDFWLAFELCFFLGSCEQQHSLQQEDTGISLRGANI